MTELEERKSGWLASKVVGQYSLMQSLLDNKDVNENDDEEDEKSNYEKSTTETSFHLERPAANILTLKPNVITCEETSPLQSDATNYSSSPIFPERNFELQNKTSHQRHDIKNRILHQKAPKINFERTKSVSFRAKELRNSDEYLRPHTAHHLSSAASLSRQVKSAANSTTITDGGQQVNLASAQENIRSLSRHQISNDNQPTAAAAAGRPNGGSRKLEPDSPALEQHFNRSKELGESDEFDLLRQSQLIPLNADDSPTSLLEAPASQNSDDETVDLIGAQSYLQFGDEPGQVDERSVRQTLISGESRLAARRNLNASLEAQAKLEDTVKQLHYNKTLALGATTNSTAPLETVTNLLPSEPVELIQSGSSNGAQFEPSIQFQPMTGDHQQVTISPTKAPNSLVQYLNIPQRTPIGGDHDLFTAADEMHQQKVSRSRQQKGTNGARQSFSTALNGWESRRESLGRGNQLESNASSPAYDDIITWTPAAGPAAYRAANFTVAPQKSLLPLLANETNSGQAEQLDSAPRSGSNSNSGSPINSPLVDRRRSFYSDDTLEENGEFSPSSSDHHLNHHFNQPQQHYEAASNKGNASKEPFKTHSSPGEQQRRVRTRTKSTKVVIARMRKPTSSGQKNTIIVQDVQQQSDGDTKLKGAADQQSVLASSSRERVGRKEVNLNDNDQESQSPAANSNDIEESGEENSNSSEDDEQEASVEQPASEQQVESSNELASSEGKPASSSSENDQDDEHHDGEPANKQPNGEGQSERSRKSASSPILASSNEPSRASPAKGSKQQNRKQSRQVDGKRKQPMGDNQWSPTDTSQFVPIDQQARSRAAHRQLVQSSLETNKLVGGQSANDMQSQLWRRPPMVSTVRLADVGERVEQVNRANANQYQAAPLMSSFNNGTPRQSAADKWSLVRPNESNQFDSENNPRQRPAMNGSGNSSIVSSNQLSLPARHDRSFRIQLTNNRQHSGQPMRQSEPTPANGMARNASWSIQTLPYPEPTNQALNYFSLYQLERNLGAGRIAHQTLDELRPPAQLLRWPNYVSSSPGNHRDFGQPTAADQQFNLGQPSSQSAFQLQAPQMFDGPAEQPNQAAKNAGLLTINLNTRAAIGPNQLFWEAAARELARPPAAGKMPISNGHLPPQHRQLPAASSIMPIMRRPHFSSSFQVALREAAQNEQLSSAGGGILTSSASTNGHAYAGQLKLPQMAAAALMDPASGNPSPGFGELAQLDAFTPTNPHELSYVSPQGLYPISLADSPFGFMNMAAAMPASSFMEPPQRFPSLDGSAPKKQTPNKAANSGSVISAALPLATPSSVSDPFGWPMGYGSKAAKSLIKVNHVAPPPAHLVPANIVAAQTSALLYPTLIDPLKGSSAPISEDPNTVINANSIKPPADAQVRPFQDDQLLDGQYSMLQPQVVMNPNHAHARARANANAPVIGGRPQVAPNYVTVTLSTRPPVISRPARLWRRLRQLRLGNAQSDSNNSNTPLGRSKRSIFGAVSSFIRGQTGKQANEQPVGDSRAKLVNSNEERAKAAHKLALINLSEKHNLDDDQMLGTETGFIPLIDYTNLPDSTFEDDLLTRALIFNNQQASARPLQASASQQPQAAGNRQPAAYLAEPSEISLTALEPPANTPAALNRANSGSSRDRLVRFSQNIINSTHIEPLAKLVKLTSNKLQHRKTSKLAPTSTVGPAALASNQKLISVAQQLSSVVSPGIMIGAPGTAPNSLDNFNQLAAPIRQWYQQQQQQQQPSQVNPQRPALLPLANHATTKALSPYTFLPVPNWEQQQQQQDRFSPTVRDQFNANEMRLSARNSSLLHPFQAPLAIGSNLLAPSKLYSRDDARPAKSSNQLLAANGLTPQPTAISSIQRPVVGRPPNRRQQQQQQQSDSKLLRAENLRRISDISDALPTINLMNEKLSLPFFKPSPSGHLINWLHPKHFDPAADREVEQHRMRFALDQRRPMARVERGNQPIRIETHSSSPGNNNFLNFDTSQFDLERAGNEIKQHSHRLPIPMQYSPQVIKTNDSFSWHTGNGQPRIYYTDSEHNFATAASSSPGELEGLSENELEANKRQHQLISGAPHLTAASSIEDSSSFDEILPISAKISSSNEAAASMTDSGEFTAEQQQQFQKQLLGSQHQLLLAPAQPIMSQNVARPRLPTLIPSINSMANKFRQHLYQTFRLSPLTSRWPSALSSANLMSYAKLQQPPKTLQQLTYAGSNSLLQEPSNFQHHFGAQTFNTFPKGESSMGQAASFPFERAPDLDRPNQPIVYGKQRKFQVNNLPVSGQSVRPNENLMMDIISSADKQQQLAFRRPPFGEGNRPTKSSLTELQTLDLAAANNGSQNVESELQTPTGAEVYEQELVEQQQQPGEQVAINETTQHEYIAAMQVTGDGQQQQQSANVMTDVGGNLLTSDGTYIQEEQPSSQVTFEEVKQRPRELNAIKLIGNKSSQLQVEANLTDQQQQILSSAEPEAMQTETSAGEEAQAGGQFELAKQQQLVQVQPPILFADDNNHEILATETEISDQNEQVPEVEKMVQYKPERSQQVARPTKQQWQADGGDKRQLVLVPTQTKRKANLTEVRLQMSGENKLRRQNNVDYQIIKASQKNHDLIVSLNNGGTALVKQQNLMAGEQFNRNGSTKLAGQDLELPDQQVDSYAAAFEQQVNSKLPIADHSLRAHRNSSGLEFNFKPVTESTEEVLSDGWQKSPLNVGLIGGQKGRKSTPSEANSSPGGAGSASVSHEHYVVVDQPVLIRSEPVQSQSQVSLQTSVLAANLSSIPAPSIENNLPVVFVSTTPERVVHPPISARLRPLKTPKSAKSRPPAVGETTRWHSPELSSGEHGQSTISSSTVASSAANEAPTGSGASSPAGATTARPANHLKNHNLKASTSTSTTSTTTTASPSAIGKLSTIATLARDSFTRPPKAKIRWQGMAGRQRQLVAGNSSAPQTETKIELASSETGRSERAWIVGGMTHLTYAPQSRTDTNASLAPANEHTNHKPASYEYSQTVEVIADNPNSNSSSSLNSNSTTTTAPSATSSLSTTINLHQLTSSSPKWPPPANHQPESTEATPTSSSPPPVRESRTGSTSFRLSAGSLLAAPTSATAPADVASVGEAPQQAAGPPASVLGETKPAPSSQFSARSDISAETIGPLDSQQQSAESLADERRPIELGHKVVERLDLSGATTGSQVEELPQLETLDATPDDRLGWARARNGRPQEDSLSARQTSGKRSHNDPDAAQIVVGHGSND